MPVARRSRNSTLADRSTWEVALARLFFDRKGKMMTDWPMIKTRRTINVSPWMQIIEREVEFAPGAKPELYHAVGQQDYTAIVARTPDGQIPIVRQYRPALERFTWELPAGLVDKGEAPEVCCRRELLEETGFTARSVHMLGSYAACTARLSNRIHSFFVEAGPRSDRPARSRAWSSSWWRPRNSPR